MTSDLREVSGLRVIERARIDQVLAEQKLQESRADLDAASSARVGRRQSLVRMGRDDEGGGGSVTSWHRRS